MLESDLFSSKNYNVSHNTWLLVSYLNQAIGTSSWSSETESHEISP